MVSTLEPAIWIAGDEDDTRDNGSWHRFADDRRSPAGKPTQPTLLPGAHDRAKPVVVGEHRPSTREGEPATGAFAATIHRPRRRSTAARAQGRLDATERRRAAVADLSARKGADETALRQEQIEHVITLREHV